MAEQFLVNALLGGVAAAFKVGDKALDAVRALKRGLETAKDALVRAGQVASRTAAAVAQGIPAGLARRVATLVDDLPFRWADELADGLARTAGRLGPRAQGVLRQVDDAEELLAVMGRLGGRNVDEVGRLMERSVAHPVENFRPGARFELDRIKHYGDDIAELQHRFPDGRRADILLKDGRVVEVKDWLPDTFHSKLKSIGDQVDAYWKHTNKDVILELKHKVNPNDIAKLQEGRPWLKITNGTG